jgi:DNA-binding transcriptional LysR family regulator
MEMHQVRYFLVLCEEGSFTRAARRCGVAQPSLTNAIRRLERDLGGALFNRSARGAAITPLGASLRRHFVRIEQSAAAIRSTAELHSRLQLQPLQQRKLAMSRSLLLSTVALVLLTSIGGFVGASMLVAPNRSAAATTATIDPYALQLAINVSALPETRIEEPF